MVLRGLSLRGTRGAASLMALLAVAVGACAGVAAANASPPPPTINDLHVTNFNPFVTPADASFDPTGLTFAPAGAGFESQGFDFTNVFTNNQFPFTITVGGHNFVFVHTYGLCGGMSYAALDTFLSGNGATTPQGSPTGSASQLPGLGLVYPPEGGSVFNYLLKRQKDSLTGGNFSAVREMAYMMALPKQHMRQTETRHHFGAIVGAIDAGHPIPLLIVEALSPGQLFENHQVLATGYFYRGGSGGQFVVQIYDPNFPGRFMYLNTYEPNNDPSQYPSEIETYDATGTEPSGVHFYGFFTTPYSYVAPPWALSKPTGNLISDPGADWIDSGWNLTTDSQGDPPGSVERPTTQYGAGAATTAVVPPPDWSPSGNFTAVRYLAPNTSGKAIPTGSALPGLAPQFPTAAYSATIHGGSNFFAGGPGNSASSATQLITLTNDASLAALIDTGQQAATLSGDLGGSGSLTASMVVAATFRNAANASLGSFSIGPVSPADRSNQTELLARSAAALVPKRTRTISVTMTASGAGHLDHYNTAFADNISLTIGPRSRIQIPVTIPKPPKLGDRQP